MRMGRMGDTAQQMASPDRYTAKNSFIYLQAITTLAPGGSTTSSFNLDGDSDFFWSKLAAWAMVADDGTTNAIIEVPAVTIIITNTTSGRQYMNAGVPLNSIAGDAGLPFILPMDTYWPAKATIQVAYANVSDNKTYSDIFLSFIGIKAFF